MREIKFRGMSVKTNKMVFGFAVSPMIFSATKEEGYSWIFVIRSPKEDQTETGWIKVSSESVGQYTGVKDKNGKESYEGDILRWFYSNYAEPCIAEVTFSNGRFDIPSEEFEIIGNIYQNLNRSKGEK